MNQAYKPLLVVLVGLIAVVAFVGLRPMLQAKEIVPWREGLREGIREANETGKPVLLYFTADWCGPCQRMKHTTWADRRVVTALANYVPVKIDFDSSPSMVAAYNVQAIPAYVIINKSGDTVRPVTEGAMGPEEFIAWLDRGPDLSPAASATTASATKPTTAPSDQKEDR